MIIEIIKLFASGNDFIFTDYKNISQKEIIRLSDRHFGIGCDQFIVLEKFDRENREIDVAIFNCDGSLTTMCGNAMRALCGFYLNEDEVFYVNIKNGKRIKIEKKNSLCEVEIEGIFENKDGLIDVGNLHKIEIIKNKNEINLDQSDVYNKNYVEILDEGTIKVTTIERGAGLTLACGSGICASAFFCKTHNLLTANKIKVITNGSEKIQELFNKKDEIFVRFEEKSLKLCGSWGFVFRTNIDIEI